MSTDHKICIFLSGALGDFVNALPALSALRQRYSASQIELVGNPSWLPLLEESCLVDRVFSQEVLPLAAAFRRPLSCSNPLERFLQPFDLVLSWFGDSEGLWERALKQLCPGSVHVFPLHRYRDHPGHVSQYFLSTLRNLGIQAACTGPGRFPWKKPVDLEGEAPGGANSGDSPYVSIHPGSGSQKKNWMPERFLEVSRSIREEWNLESRILLGPAERGQKSFWEGIQMPGLIVLSDLSLVALARLLSGTRLYLGNDSGVTHLASCVGAPVVALFGPTDPARWGPTGESVSILQGKTSCAPCGSSPQAECTSPDCLRVITTDQVLEAAERVLRIKHSARQINRKASASDP